MNPHKAPRLVTVAIFTTITIVFWVFFTLYNILTSSPSLEIDPALLEPIDPKLDTSSLSQIENRIFFEADDATVPFIDTELPTPTPETTEAAIETPTETPSTATGSSVLE